MKSFFSCLLLAVALGACGSQAQAQVVSPYQPAYRPLGLSVVGQTYLGGTDATSLLVQALVPTYVSYIKQMLPEGVAFTGEGLYQLDPQRLYFYFAYAPRVYYVYEGACYLDALGVTIGNAAPPSSSPPTGTNYTVFPLGQSSVSPVCAPNTGVRSTDYPLMAGDFVQLPTVNSGQQLAFFLMSNMNSSGTPANTYYNGTTTNADNFQHMVAFFPDNSQYMIIGFEDLYGGGDRDCNDFMFIVDVGPNNAAAWRAPSSLAK